VSAAKIAANDSITVSVEVTNTGVMAGDEVVELYLTHAGFAGAPLRALQGFQRIHLDRGEKKTVSFTLRDRDLSVVDQAGKRRIVPGRVEVWIGSGQPTALARVPQPAGGRTEFSVTSESTLPE
jgi:beta-glucosidase